jgi:hypothetical protein
MREAVGEQTPDQPMEPARNCRRGHTRPGAEHLAVLSGAFFKKEADLKPHCIRYWLTPKPDPAFDSKCADICAVYKAAAGADDTHRTISIDEMTGIQALDASRRGCRWCWTRSSDASSNISATALRPLFGFPSSRESFFAAAISPAKSALRTKIEQFIAYFNETMAKPFHWTMEARPLAG